MKSRDGKTPHRSRHLLVSARKVGSEGIRTGRSRGKSCSPREKSPREKGAREKEAEETAVVQERRVLGKQEECQAAEKADMPPTGNCEA